MTRDQLNSVPAWEAVRLAYAAVSAVQSTPPASQVAGIALLFTAMCEGTGVDPSELINQSKRRAIEAANMDEITLRQEMRALRAYVKGELA